MGTPEDPFRAKIPGSIISYGALIPSKADGSPKFGWGLVKIDAADYSLILADSTIFAFPNKPLTSLLTTQERNAIKTKLANLGMTTTDIITSMTLKDILLKVGKFLESAVKEL